MQLMIGAGTKIQCPGCAAPIGRALANIYTTDVLDESHFNWTKLAYRNGEPAECYQCGAEWVSEAWGILTEFGWYPPRH